MKVRPVSITQSLIPQVEGPLELVAYCARVSNPANQENVRTGPRLVDYLVRHRHWSPPPGNGRHHSRNRDNARHCATTS